MHISNAVLYENGEEIGIAKEIKIKIAKPVKIKHDTRWGHGYNFEEKYYLCPTCGKLLAYHNGVILIFGDTKAKYCKHCGNEIYWESENESSSKCEA